MEVESMSIINNNNNINPANDEMMLAETVLFAEGEIEMGLSAASDAAAAAAEPIPTAPTITTDINTVSTDSDPATASAPVAASADTTTNTTTTTTSTTTSDSFAHNLEDHQVVLKEKGSPTNATKVFREHVCAAFPRSRVFDIDQMKALQDMYYKCKFSNLYPPNTPIPSVTFWVSYEKGLRHEQWVSSGQNKEDLRFSKDNDVAFVPASEECLRDYVRNVGGRSPQDRRQRKRLKQDDPTHNASDVVPTMTLREASSMSSSTTTTTVTATTTTGLSLSPLTITPPNTTTANQKVFQLVGLEDLRSKATEVLQQWKASSSGYEAMMKEMHIWQFWKDYDKYESLLQQHPLEVSTTHLDDYQKGRQVVHEGLLVDIVNALGNAMVDWYNADYLARMNNAAASHQNNPSSDGSSGGGPSPPHHRGGNDNGNSGSRGGNMQGGGGHHPFGPSGGGAGTSGGGSYQSQQGQDSLAFFPGGGHQYAIGHPQASEDSESYYSSDYYDDDNDTSWYESDSDDSEFSSFVSDIEEDATSITYPSSEDDDDDVSSELDSDGEPEALIKHQSEKDSDRLIQALSGPLLLRQSLFERINDASLEESKEEDVFSDDEDDYDDDDDDDPLFHHIRSDATALSDFCANYMYQQQQEGGGGKGNAFCMDEMYMQQCRAELLKIRFQRLRHYSFDPGCSSSYSKLSNVSYGRTSYNSWLQQTVSDPDIEMLEDDMADLCRLGVAHQRMVRTS